MIKTFLSPAKINLMLNVTGKRADGYHELQTVFQFLDLCDEMQFEITSNPALELHCDLDLPSQQNLIWRAARLLQEQTHCEQGAIIRVKKHIPLGGGLGGGSSNAATTLVALNHLWQTGLTRAQLCALGLQLGADVPVFVHGQAVWAEGVGEQFQPITLEEGWALVIHPQVHSSTAQVFQNAQCHAPLSLQQFQQGQQPNTLTTNIFRKNPEIKQVFEWLSAYGDAKVSGTGACVFLKFMDNTAPRRVKEQVPSSWQSWITKCCNSSLLYRNINISC